MLTRTYEAFSVLLGVFCSTHFLEHVKLAGFALSNASVLKKLNDARRDFVCVISENGR